MVLMPSDMHDYRTNGVGQHRPPRRIPARSECDVSEPRLLRRRAAGGVRALSGVAARAGAPTGAVSGPAARRVARRSTSRTGRLRRRGWDDLVFVPNASAGVNIAAWALDLGPGDEVLSTDLEYGALDLTWEHVCGDFRARYVRTPIR